MSKEPVSKTGPKQGSGLERGGGSTEDPAGHQGAALGPGGAARGTEPPGGTEAHCSSSAPRAR